MSILDYYEEHTDPIPENLLHALKSGQCLLLVGAGISRICLSRTRKPLPDWPSLLEGLVVWAIGNEYVDDESGKELQVLLRKGEFLVAAQELIEQAGLISITHYLDEVFDPSGIVPSRRHELIVSLPVRGILTTNYDNLIERAFQDVQNRQIEVIRVDQTERWKDIHEVPIFMLKLHGDLSQPESLVLGHRSYMRLIYSKDYEELLDSMFSNYSVLMIGYSLNDEDIKGTLDRLASKGKASRTHYLLAQEGAYSAIEKRRFLEDRHIEVIEYHDYFGYHNHIDTFVEALAMSVLDNGLSGVKNEIRARISVHYPPECEKDGLFLLNFFFRAGAVTLAEGFRSKQLEHLRDSIGHDLFATDYLIFVLEEPYSNIGEYNELMLAAINKAKTADVGVIFLVIGAEGRPELVKEHAPFAPVFYLPQGFSEKEMQKIRNYIEQDLIGGIRQP